jgi:hypothetical protein
MGRQLNVRVDDGLWDAVQAARGDVSLTRWVVRALEEKLAMTSVGSAGDPSRGSQSVERFDSLGPGSGRPASPRAPEVVKDQLPEVVLAVERAARRASVVPRAAGFNVGPKPFRGPVPKGK